MNAIHAWLSLIYGFEKEFVKYKCFCKATNREVSAPRYSHNWAVAKRAFFKVFDDRIECGDWNIPFAQVESAHVYKTKQMFVPARVLQLDTSSGSFQFGFNPWANPFKHLNIKYEESEVKLGYSVFSVLIRIIFLAYIAYVLWLGWKSGA